MNQFLKHVSNDTLRDLHHIRANEAFAQKLVDDLSAVFEVEVKRSRYDNAKVTFNITNVGEISVTASGVRYSTLVRSDSKAFQALSYSIRPEYQENRIIATATRVTGNSADNSLRASARREVVSAINEELKKLGAYLKVDYGSQYLKGDHGHGLQGYFQIEFSLTDAKTLDRAVQTLTDYILRTDTIRVRFDAVPDQTAEIEAERIQEEKDDAERAARAAQYRKDAPKRKAAREAKKKAKAEAKAAAAAAREAKKNAKKPKRVETVEHATETHSEMSAA